MATWFLLAAAAMGSASPTSGWIRPVSDSEALVWGRTDGVVFGIPSDGGMPGPRGLVRIGIWNAETEKPELINFVAIEPVVAGGGSRFQRMAFSELEPSMLDAPARGKRLSAVGDVCGTLEGDRLTVRIEVEPFTANGAHVYLLATMSSHAPDEVAFQVFHHDDSAPIEEHTLTATMGNYERLRRLWLADRVIDSRKLYAGYDGDAFVERDAYPLSDTIRTPNGDALVVASSDESDPASVAIDHPWWRYKSVKLTQYWRVPAAHVQPDLRVRVNGRRVYWANTLEIPGGISFENFEVRQRYAPGQVSVFGLSRLTPWQLVPSLAGFLPEEAD
ncbi:hypothetical protein FJZ36_09590 [Candidatus Poribacteria bacterium]|nr:hypothetical protein [Candidatus Poribacteria bacterium]